MSKSILAASAALMLSGNAVHALTVDGIEFANGADAFVNSVVSYTLGYDTGVGNAAFNDPTNALGVPQGGLDFFSMGNGGVATFQFGNAGLTTSGSSANDLYIFEIGNSIEEFQVEISKDLINWINLGIVTGQAEKGIDIDAALGVNQGDVFTFVRITDSLLDPDTEFPIGGADIAGIGAITAVELAPVPLPAAGLMLLAGLGTLAAARRRKAT